MSLAQRLSLAAYAVLLTACTSLGQPAQIDQIGSTLTIVDYREIDAVNNYKGCQIDGLFTNNGVFGTGLITDVAYFLDANDNTLSSAMIQIPGALPGKTARFSVYATGVGCQDFTSIIISGDRYTLPPKG